MPRWRRMPPRAGKPGDGLHGNANGLTEAGKEDRQ
jgi:hypothetical protein